MDLSRSIYWVATKLSFQLLPNFECALLSQLIYAVIWIQRQVLCNSYFLQILPREHPFLLPSHFQTWGPIYMRDLTKALVHLSIQKVFSSLVTVPNSSTLQQISNCCCFYLTSESCQAQDQPQYLVVDYRQISAQVLAHRLFLDSNFSF